MTTDVKLAAPPLRERIMGAAFDAFMDLGYAGASTSEIARRAKVSKRDLYAAFGSKQAMLAACIAERAALMRRPLDLPEPRSRAALVATLMAFGTLVLREVARPEVLAVHRLAILEAERSPEVALTLEELGRTGSKTALAGLLRGAQAAGLLGDGDPGDLAEIFLAVLWRGGLMIRLLLRVEAGPDEAEATARARFAVEVVLSRAGGG
jgi:AcrR family transcriptional regulator